MSALTVMPLAKPADAPQAPAPQANPARLSRVSAPTGGAVSRTDEASQGFGFADFVDTINPLQQLPLVGNLYRAVTGDEISQQARYAGSALYGMALGGPVGMGAFLGMAMVGDAVGDHFEGRGVAVATSDVGDPASQTAELSAMDSEPARGAPTDLFQWLRPEVTGAHFPAAIAEPLDEGTGQPPVVPASVDGLAADPDNHLPLSVLETLRQRHMDMLGDEQA